MRRFDLPWRHFLDEYDAMISLTGMPSRQGLSLNRFLLTSASIALTLSQSVLQAQTIHFEALAGKGGKQSTSSCVFLDAKGNLATVVGLGSDLKKATLKVDGKEVSLSYGTSDPHSRLAILKLPEDSLSLVKKPVELGRSLDMKVSQSVHTSASKEGGAARVVGKVGYFQGKTLPLAVIRLNHSQAAPLPGTGIYDENGQLVGLVRQTVFGEPNSSYCLPVEVIVRTIKDQEKNGKIRRCWIGIVMDELVAPPIVESVRPGSPAQKAGLKNGDVILSIGEHKVGSYAEVVDAFFYLIAGEPKIFKILRGTEVKEIKVMPEASPS